MAIIKEVLAEGTGARAGLLPGDEILQINEKPVRDYIDFLYRTAGEDIFLQVKKGKSGKKENIRIINQEDNLGITLEGICFDHFFTCRNKCVFCFIDQGGPVSRETLKIKDDDYRFSFLQGSFITLTNLNSTELQRIKELKISPLYISVHSTSPRIRGEMMGNEHAGNIMALLEDLTAVGITFHTQIVVCPGYNDGPELERTLKDLYSLGENILSIGIVPVGLTRYRQGLAHLEPVEREGAQEIMKTIDRWQPSFLQVTGSRVVYGADELLALAGWEVPPSDYYEDFPQLENGIGMASLFREESEEILQGFPCLKKGPVGLITGKLGVWTWQPILDKLQQKGLEIFPLMIKSHFFGPHISAAGLITGEDILFWRKRKEKLPSQIFLPRSMFNDNLETLDGYRFQEIKRGFEYSQLELAGDLEEILKKIN